MEITFPLQHALGLDGEFVDAGVFSARANYDRAGTVRTDPRATERLQ